MFTPYYLMIPMDILNYINPEDIFLLDGCLAILANNDETIMYEIIDYLTDDVFDNDVEYSKELDRLTDVAIKLIDRFIPFLKRFISKAFLDNFYLEEIVVVKNMYIIKFLPYA